MAHISLEQWQALIAVVEAGGYAQAAERLFKSQSSVSYAVQKIENLLGVKAFEIQGRKAILTTTGQMLYRRAQFLVNEANDLEKAAHRLSAGWESTITLAVEILSPSSWLLDSLAQFGQESPHTRIEVIESVLSGTAELLHNREVDFAITPQIPPGFLGDILMPIYLRAVTHAEHPLQKLGRELSYQDLRTYRHVVVRDSGVKRDPRAVSVEVNQRWTVSQISTSIQAVTMGYGFAWLPEEHIKEELTTGLLKPLPLREGCTRELSLYLIMANPDFVGPGVKRLIEIIKESVSN
jgi:DNA-binding transcriptional LysR family regulator